MKNRNVFLLGLLIGCSFLEAADGDRPGRRARRPMTLEEIASYANYENGDPLNTGFMVPSDSSDCESLSGKEMSADLVKLLSDYIDDRVVVEDLVSYVSNFCELCSAVKRNDDESQIWAGVCQLGHFSYAKSILLKMGEFENKDTLYGFIDACLEAPALPEGIEREVPEQWLVDENFFAALAAYCDAAIGVEY